MKLDIEALAREAGITCDYCGYTGGSKEELEALARLIVERCAVECFGLIESDHLTAYKHGCNDSAAAIRNLLKD